MSPGLTSDSPGSLASPAGHGSTGSHTTGKLLLPKSKFPSNNQLCLQKLRNQLSHNLFALVELSVWTYTEMKFNITSSQVRELKLKFLSSPLVFLGRFF